MSPKAWMPSASSAKSPRTFHLSLLLMVLLWQSRRSLRGKEPRCTATRQWRCLFPSLANGLFTGATKAIMHIRRDGKVTMIADRVRTVTLTLPNFASYDAEGNLYVSNSSTRDINNALTELSKPEPNGALVRIRPGGKGEVVATGIYLAN